MRPTLKTAPLRSLARGFTLVELAVTIAILAIMASMAAPAFQGMIASSRVTATTNEILELLALAQSEARNRQTTVGITISSTSNGQTWSMAPTNDSSNVIASLFINSNANVQVNNGFTAISFQPNGTLAETTTNKSVRITSTSSYTSKARSIQILGGGKVILLNQ